MFLQHGVKEGKEKNKNFLLLLFFSLIKLTKTKSLNHIKNRRNHSFTLEKIK